MKTLKLLVITALAALGAPALVTSDAQAASTSAIPHLEKNGTATRLVVDDQSFLMLAGELHNSSTSSIEYMTPIWPRMAAKNLNTVIAAVSWELIEPEEGRFDFSLVDAMITDARENHLRLVLIWFGSWKNGASTYIPSWVKKDPERFPRVQDASGKTLEILSTLGETSREADARAFAALLRHVREVDGRDHTVVMVQVENEVGVLNSPRDYSPAANEAFAGQVPKPLMDYLQTHRDELIPEFREVWQAHGFKISGTWEEVFGKGELYENDWKALSYFTEELFMAWHYARYIGRVAEAGKAEYPLPMFVNAWLMQPNDGSPGKYPSGGPLPQVMDVWRAGAPSIDMIVPDIYIPQFKWICEQFHRNGNPLFIPETIGGALGAARVFWAIGEHDAMGFAPFGIDGRWTPENDPLDASYETLTQLAPLILEHQGQDTMAGVLLDEEHPNETVKLGGYTLEARLRTRGEPAIAGGIILWTGPDEFLIAAASMEIRITSDPPGESMVGLDTVDEGIFKDGKWISGRRLNGDEVLTSTFSGASGLRFRGDTPGIQRVTLYRYH